MGWFKRIAIWFKDLSTSTPASDRKKPNRSTTGNTGIEHLHPKAKFLMGVKKMQTWFDFKFDDEHAFVVHYTAGHRKQKFSDFLRSFRDNGLCTYFIDGEGQLWQQFDGDRSGYHAGRKSVFPKRCKLGGKKISKRAAGVEIANAGILTKKKGRYYTWFNKEIPSKDTRTITREKAKFSGYQFAGVYQMYTEKQEDTLAHLIAWHIANGIPVENIVGHDEIARPHGRKTDPGGALSLPLNEFVKKKCLPLVEQYLGVEVD